MEIKETITAALALLFITILFTQCTVRCGEQKKEVQAKCIDSGKSLAECRIFLEGQ